ncbi:MAG: ATP-binding protein [Acidimicrobiales bacterium]
MSHLAEALLAASWAVSLGALVAMGLARRGVRRRIDGLVARLSEDQRGQEPESLEGAMVALERATGQAAGRVSDASGDMARLSLALDALPQGVVICDETGKVVFKNNPATLLTGARHGEVLATAALTELLDEAAGGNPGERTLELYGPPRRTFTLRTEALESERRNLGTVAVIEDVSLRRQLDKVRKDFVANVSHELKTPVGALGLLAETLLAEPDPGVARRLADRIHAEAFRVSRIIDDLLDLSRIEAEEAPPREPVPVSLVLAEATERVREASDQHGVAIELEEPGEPAAIVGDRRQLVSAVFNLLENAVKYSQPGSKVIVRAEDRGGTVDLVVRDFGIGIPARDQERIFERFYRVDRGRSRQTGGTGLGLSIVRHVASNHNGTVLVQSREGEGSTFTLRLPLWDGPPIPGEGAGDYLGRGYEEEGYEEDGAEDRRYEEDGYEEPGYEEPGYEEQAPDSLHGERPGDGDA